MASAQEELEAHLRGLGSVLRRPPLCNRSGVSIGSLHVGQANGSFRQNSLDWGEQP